MLEDKNYYEGYVIGKTKINFSKFKLETKKENKALKAELVNLFV